MGFWEQMHNPDFNVTEFSYIRNEAGSNGYVLSSKQWIEKTNAIGIISKPGRYGGTYAHKDIAFEFGSWISAELIKNKVDKGFRFNQLREIAQYQINILGNKNYLKAIKKASETTYIDEQKRLDK